MFALLGAVALFIAALIGFGAVTWPHLLGWALLGFALLALHFAIAVALPRLAARPPAPPQ